MAWPVAPSTAAIFPASSSTPISVSYDSVPSRTYVLIVAKTSATASIDGVQDDAGNTWTRLDYAPKSGSVGRRIEAWICTPVNPFTEVQIVNPGLTLTYATLIEVAGTTGVVNAVLADHRSGSTAPAAVTITPTVADCLVIAGVMANSNKTADITAPAGWNYLSTHADGPQLVYRTDAPADQPIGVDWTFAISQGSGHVILALEASDDVPGPVVTVWNGTSELPAYIEGVWDGTTVQPASIESLT